MKTIIKIDAKTFYLDYLNNYLTISRIAEDYNINYIRASRLLNLGRHLMLNY
jgi:hypothetical protein